MLIARDMRPASPMMNIALTLLLDFFDGEEHAGAKATAMSRPLVQCLNRLGEEWKLTEAELSGVVIEILVAGKTAVDGDTEVEYVTGQRRDTMRLEGR
jgi:hypothetical protein